MAKSSTSSDQLELGTAKLCQTFTQHLEIFVCCPSVFFCFSFLGGLPIEITGLVSGLAAKWRFPETRRMPRWPIAWSTWRSGPGAFAGWGESKTEKKLKAGGKQFFKPFFFIVPLVKLSLAHFCRRFCCFLSSLTKRFCFCSCGQNRLCNDLASPYRQLKRRVIKGHPMLGDKP